MAVYMSASVTPKSPSQSDGPMNCITRAVDEALAAGTRFDASLLDAQLLRQSKLLSMCDDGTKYVHVDGRRLEEASRSRLHVLHMQDWSDDERAFATRHASKWGWSSSTDDAILERRTNLGVTHTVSLKTCIERATAEGGLCIKDIVADYKGAHMDLHKIIAQKQCVVFSGRVWGIHTRRHSHSTSRHARSATGSKPTSTGGTSARGAAKSRARRSRLCQKKHTRR